MNMTKNKIIGAAAISILGITMAIGGGTNNPAKTKAKNDLLLRNVDGKTVLIPNEGEYISVIPTATNAGIITYEVSVSTNAPAPTITVAESTALQRQALMTGFNGGIDAMLQVELEEKKPELRAKALKLATQGR